MKPVEEIKMNKKYCNLNFNFFYFDVPIVDGRPTGVENMRIPGDLETNQDVKHNNKQRMDAI